MKQLPSRELTYPPKMAFWRWFPFPKVGYVNSLEGHHYPTFHFGISMIRVWCLWFPPKSVTYMAGTSARCGPWSQGLLGTTWKIQTFCWSNPMLKMNRFSHFFQHIIDIHKNVLESFYIHKHVLGSVGHFQLIQNLRTMVDIQKLGHPIDLTHQFLIWLSIWMVPISVNLQCRDRSHK